MLPAMHSKVAWYRKGQGTDKDTDFMVALIMKWIVGSWARIRHRKQLRGQKQAKNERFGGNRMGYCFFYNKKRGQNLF